MKDRQNAATTYKQLAFGEPSSEDTIVLSDAIKRFFVNPKEIKGYRRLAAVWLGLVMCAIVAAIIAIIWVFSTATPSASEREDGYSSSRSSRDNEVPNVVLTGLQGVLILVPLIFLLRFANRSYRINKHLEVTYAHRWALQQSLAEYIEIAGPGANREQMVMEVLPFFYSDIETGYITKKDGLGDKEIIPPALLKNISRG